MEIILLENNLYHLIQITKDMLEGIIIPKGSDCFNLCDIIRENFTVYDDSKNYYKMIGHNSYFIGCICR
jgi:hypothetical protein